MIDAGMIEGPLSTIHTQPMILQLGVVWQVPLWVSLVAEEMIVRVEKGGT